MIEYIPILLKIGKTGSLVMVAAGGLILCLYSITKIINPGTTYIPPTLAVESIIRGTALQLIFVALEIIAKKYRPCLMGG